jgi:type II secretory pathway pseudopilin PulG
MLKIKNQKFNKGFSLIEMVFYISIFIILSLVTIDAIIALTKSFKATKVNIELAQAGTIIEKIIKIEI